LACPDTDTRLGSPPISGRAGEELTIRPLRQRKCDHRFGNGPSGGARSAVGVTAPMVGRVDDLGLVTSLDERVPVRIAANFSAVGLA
jgi:hypothetical protein